MMDVPVSPEAPTMPMRIFEVDMSHMGLLLVGVDIIESGKMRLMWRVD